MEPLSRNHRSGRPIPQRPIPSGESGRSVDPMNATGRGGAARIEDGLVITSACPRFPCVREGTPPGACSGHVGSCQSIGRQPELRLAVITKAGTAPAVEATVAVSDMHCTTRQPMRCCASRYSAEVAAATSNSARALSGRTGVAPGAAGEELGRAAGTTRPSRVHHRPPARVPVLPVAPVRRLS